MIAAILLSVLWAVPAVVTEYIDQGEPTQQPLNQVGVTIYYEALCPDSQKFFNEQFQPNMKIISDNAVEVDLVPFGKEKHEYDQATSQWLSTCRHTATECEGHRVQACAVHHLTKPNPLLPYIACLMKRGQKGKTYPTAECGEHLKREYPDLPVQSIQDCASSAEVENFVESNHQRTQQLQPPIKSVPVIVFNGVYNQEDQNAALKNFRHVLCKHLADNAQDDKACSEHSSAQGHPVALALIVVTTLLAALI